MLNRRWHLVLSLAVVGWVIHPGHLSAQRLGVTIARTTSDIITTYGDGDKISYQNRDAFAAGLTYRHMLRRRMVLQPELWFVRKGYGTASRPTRTLGYVEVPLLLRFGALPAKGATFSPVLSIGPTLATLATCRLQGLEAISTSERCEQVITTPFAYDYRM